MSIEHDWKIAQMDAITAFLQGELNEEIYMMQPEGCHDGSPKVCKLNKAIYGLKQASRMWNHELDLALKKCGLSRSNSDPSIYFGQHNMHHDSQNTMTLSFSIKSKMN